MRPQRIKATDPNGQLHTLQPCRFKYYDARVWEDVDTRQLFTVSAFARSVRYCAPLICEPDELEADE